MFIFIPLTLIVISGAGIAFIVWRKIPYLKKLDVESLASNGTSLTWREFFNDMLPEIDSQHLKFKQFKDLWLLELEKFIRRARLIFLKIDNISSALIKKIRRVNRQKSVAEQYKGLDVLKNYSDKTNDKAAEPEVNGSGAAANLKKKEQALIISIAKEPKKFELYVELADLYIELQQWKDAEESLKVALDLKPDDEELTKKLSLVLEKSDSQD